MKKILSFLFIFVMLLFSVTAYAGQKIVTIQWDQSIEETEGTTNKPIAYDLYYSFNGVPVEITKTFNFEDAVNTTGNTYQYSFNITGDDGTDPTLSVALEAWNNDNDGNKQLSGKSNTATKVFHFPIIYLPPNRPDMILIILNE